MVPREKDVLLLRSMLQVNVVTFVDQSYVYCFMASGGIRVMEVDCVFTPDKTKAMSDLHDSTSHKSTEFLALTFS